MARPARAFWPVVATVVIFSALSIYCAIRSEGFVNGDACMHYLSARFAFSSPQNFVDVWNRPLVVMLDAVPAWLGGRLAVRLVSLLMALGCGGVAYVLADRQGVRWPVLALIFTLGQPILFVHSFSEMTELPFALLLGLAFLAYQRERLFLAVALVAWAPLARPEGFGLVAVLGVALLLRRRWAGIVLLPIPTVLWNLAGWYLVDSRRPAWRWLIDAWPWAGHSVYGHGQLLAMVGQLPAIVSPMVLPATLAGIWICFRTARKHGEGKPDHLRLIALVPLLVLIAHSLLYWLGLMASDGEARYLLIAAPFWGVLSALGWEWIFSRLQWSYPVRWAAAAVLVVPIAANAVRPAVPLQLADDWKIARNIAAWYRANPIHQGYPKVMAAHPAIFYFLDINPYGSAQAPAWDKPTLRAARPGTILLWDAKFGPSNSSAERAFSLEEVRSAGWIELDVPAARGSHEPDTQRKDGDPGSSWKIFVSRAGW